MTQTPGARPTGELIGVYRTMPARILGWTMVAGAGVLTALTAWDVSVGRQDGVLGAIALIVGIATVAWVLFLRPHVRLLADRVVLANVVSDTTVPFDAVDEITHQWSLELRDHQGRRHSSWAVPVKRERVRRTGIDDFAETTRRRGTGGVTAQTVADVVQRALQRWRLDGGQLQVGEGARTRQDLSWPAIAALGAALALGLISVLG
ncbi:hypothetical protein ACI3EY_12675 [Ornithinimicrobium sp. LYQ92]|uniref:hypothetical protein n=1 Tax=Serinicoccus sp. LYQ92 TaxID=3378798 RepID=UPI003854FC40